MERRKNCKYFVTGETTLKKKIACTLSEINHKVPKNLNSKSCKWKALDPAENELTTIQIIAHAWLF